MTAKFKLSADADGPYRFYLIAGNGVTLATSEPYSSIADARRGMAALQRAASEAHVPDDDDDVDIQGGVHMHL